MVVKYLTLLLVLILAGLIQSANILGLFPTQYKSHFIVFQPLLEKLVERGHQVDVVSHFPRKEPLNGYTDFSIRIGEEYYSMNVELEAIGSVSFLDVLKRINFYCGVNICEKFMNYTSIQNLMNTTKKYDLIITEIFITDCLIGFNKIFNVPIIALTSSVNLPWASDIIGLPDNPSYIPNYFSPYTEDMTLYEKFMNTFVLLFMKAWHKYYPNAESNKFLRKTFGENTPQVEEFQKNISLVMVNSHFSLQQSRPVPPNFIEIGGIHLKSNPILPKKFEHLLETDLKGVIFLSFGTLFKSETFPDYKLKPFFEALSQVPYKILWKGEKSNVAKHLNIPSNIHFVSWIPQQELLCHPNLKLFISHCGLAGAQEAIYCGKPILGLPVWVDQFATAKLVSDRGWGLSIPLLGDVTKEKLSNALHELLENPKFNENVRRASNIFRDRLVSPLNTAVYWTEYVIRHKGAQHLKSKAADLNFYEYYCLDVALCLVCVGCILAWIIYKVLSLILSIRIHFKIFKNKLD